MPTNERVEIIVSVKDEFNNSLDLLRERIMELPEKQCVNIVNIISMMSRNTLSERLSVITMVNDSESGKTIGIITPSPRLLYVIKQLYSGNVPSAKLALLGGFYE